MSKGFLLKKSKVQIPTTQQILHHVKKISFVLKDIFFYTYQIYIISLNSLSVSDLTLFILI